MNSGPGPGMYPRDMFTSAAGWTIKASGGRWGFVIASSAILL